MRAKWLSLLMIGMVALMVPSAGTIAAAASVPTAYLALGDSLAVGTGATDPERLGYVARFFTYLHAPAHSGVDQLYNVGVNGETSATLRTNGQLGQALDVIGDAGTDVRVVSLDIGGNDFYHLLYDPATGCQSDPAGPACRAAVATALVAFAGHYQAIIEALVTALSADPGEEAVLVLTFANPFSGTGSIYEQPIDVVVLGSDLQIDCGALGGPDPARIGLNDLIACIGQAYGATVVDVYPSFAGKGATLTHIGEGTLDIHPTNAGHAVIATALRKSYPSAGLAS